MISINFTKNIDFISSEKKRKKTEKIKQKDKNRLKDEYEIIVVV